MRNLNWIIVWIIAIFSITPLARSTQAQSSERCFRETGFCISGHIRAYWEKHGGLEIFGYPITAVRNQTNKDAWTGPTQWFERDRLEDHNAQGLGVLAGRLGADLLIQQGRPWQFGPNAAPPGPDCRLFRETGYYVCDSYLRYWEEHGGLERFGYPITDVQTTQDTGREVRSEQYFERRRMELLRSEAVGYPSILLGLLGNELGTGVPNWPVKILSVDKRSVPEMVVLQNVSNTPVDLTGWYVSSERRHQGHCCLQGAVLAPGEIHSYPHEGPGPVFEDDLRNDALLYDAGKHMISYWVDW